MKEADSCHGRNEHRCASHVNIMLVKTVMYVQSVRKRQLAGESHDAAVATVCHFSGNKELKT